MENWKTRLPQYWKGLAALFGALLIFLNSLVGLNFWSETADRWINTAIAFVVALAVFLKKNVNAVEKLTGVDIDADSDVGVDEAEPMAQPKPPPQPPMAPKGKHRQE
jgi:hypothetical protein